MRNQARHGSVSETTTAGVTDPKRERRPVTSEELLASHSPQVRAAAERLRALLGAWIPEVEERVLPGWRAFGYRHPDAGHICALFPREDEVRLYIEYGAEVADPSGLLEGDTRQTRYLRFRSARAIRASDVRPLVLGGLAAAGLRRRRARRRRDR